MILHDLTSQRLMQFHLSESSFIIWPQVKLSISCHKVWIQWFQQKMIKRTARKIFTTINGFAELVFLNRFVVTELFCALLPLYPSPILVLFGAEVRGYLIKQKFHVIFCLKLKLFTLGKMILNSASRRWMLLISGE